MLLYIAETILTHLAPKIKLIKIGLRVLLKIQANLLLNLIEWLKTLLVMRVLVFLN